MTQYRYNSTDLVRDTELTEREEFLLKASKTFCIYPWIHLHAYPTGKAYPCCHAEMAHPVGDCKSQTLEQIWQGSKMAELRDNMLNERKSLACVRCYEQEDAGFFSGRRSANKHHGHHVNKVSTTPFKMVYWDIRFSNLCNLRCRSCGHIFSSSWYQDQAALAGPQWQRAHRPLNYAGRTETDMWEQLLPHIDYVEQIYFAGGEPLLMEEHYRILDELEQRGKFDVRLIYNTNFTHTDLRGRSVFDYWRRFQNVAVGASIDGMQKHGEYIRKGTVWDQVVRNREEMLKICPTVDFYISPTLSILNAWHLPELHQKWVNLGLIKHQDVNVNILQDPAHYRIDIAPIKYKQQLRVKFEEHIEWLRPHDRLERASNGFVSAIRFMTATDNQHLITQFWNKTREIDHLRGENLLDAIPELEALL